MAQRSSTQTFDPPHPELERLYMSYEQFQEWYTEGRRGEWVDGEDIPFVAPLIVHQRISRFLTVLLSDFVEDRDLGEVLQAPVEMRLRDGASYREPDLLFVASDNASRITARRVDGAADLVVEIISDDSERRDRDDEYAEGMFVQRRASDDGRLSSTVLPGLWINPGWLWRERLPKVREVLELFAGED